MIVLRRKTREQIVINGNIIVTVMNIRGSRVSIGIEAPEGVRILRAELRPREAPTSKPFVQVSEGVVVSAPVVS
jgi:carbon storage regulator CsrA